MRQFIKSPMPLFFRLLRKLTDVSYDVRHRGLKIALKRVFNNLWSVNRLLVYRYQHNNNIKNKPIAQKNIVIVELTELGDHYWIESLVNSWPKELEQYRKKKHLKSAIISRIVRGEICILAHSSQLQILGAVWIANISPLLEKINDNPPYTLEKRMIKSLFVIHEMRGKGIGKFLLSEAVNRAQQRGMNVIYSLIIPNRKGSVIAHETIGFELINEMHIKSIFFRKKINHRMINQ